jgi:betaine-homocysteine S-methyltransferase
LSVAAKKAAGSEKHDIWGEGLRMHTKPWVRARAHREYWEQIKPATGRCGSAACSKPDNWGITKGCEELKQKKEATTDDEIRAVMTFQKA